MKRWILAGAALCFGVAGTVHADYVRIRINLASPEKNLNQLIPKEFQGGGGLGVAGGVPGGGLGAAGGIPGGVPGGPGGAGALPGGGGIMGGVMQGPGGFGGGRGRGGDVDAPGGPGGAGFPGGQPGGNFGNRGGNAGFQPGLRGAGIPGAGMFGNAGGLDGVPGGIPGGGAGGPGFGMRGGPGFPGMGPGGPGMPGMGGEYFFDEEFTPLWIEAIVEVDSDKIFKGGNTGRWQISHKWSGKDAKGKPLYTSLSFNVELEQIKIKSVAQRFEEEKRRRVNQARDDGARAEGLVVMSNWCLQHGLAKRIPDLMTQLEQIVPKHPVVQEYKKITAAMAKGPSREDDAAFWKEKFGEYREKKGKHYTLFYNKELDEATAQSRLDKLEDNYQNFFLWFALNGKPLPVPTQRLVALLVKEPEEFQAIHKEAFDSAPTATDGFLARRENLAVFSATRLDENFQILKDQAKGALFTNNFNFDELLQGKGWRGNVDATAVTEAQTYALVFRALLEEAETAAVTHEGTRQLIAAVGWLPKSVHAPYWVEFGMASFFETSKGACWSGMGIPSWQYQDHLKKLDDAKKLGTPAEVLKQTITDFNFREARDASDAGEKQKYEMRGRTLSWALTYYLMNQHRDKLEAYYRELTLLPRDLDFDDDTLVACFGRAMGLMDAANPARLDNDKFAKFAGDFRRYFKDVPKLIADGTKKTLEQTLSTRLLQQGVLGGGGFPGEGGPGGGGLPGGGQPDR